MIYVDSTHGNGKFVNQFAELQSLKDDYLLVVSRKNQETYTISYEDIKKQIFEHIKANLSVGSMAYRRYFQYSNANHNHDSIYNSFSYKSNYESESNEDVQTLAYVYSSKLDKPYVICAPIVNMSEQEKIQTGTLRFVYNKKLHFYGLSGLNSNEFDGWIVPDGQRIPISQITNNNYDWSQHEFFNQNDQTLDIPLIQDFLRFEPSNDANINTVIPFVNDIPSHIHYTKDISCKINGSIDQSNGDFTFNIIGSQTGTSNGILYSGGENCLSSEQVCSIIQTKDKILEFTISSDLNVEQTYPAYDSVPVLMYLGGGYK